MISAIIVVAKKKSFLKIGEAEATRVDVSDYGDTVYASSSATYSKTQWLKVIINIFIFAVIMIYILFNSYNKNDCCSKSNKKIRKKHLDFKMVSNKFTNYFFIWYIKEYISNQCFFVFLKKIKE